MRIRVLFAAARRVLLDCAVRYLSDHSDIDVVATARDGRDALRNARRLKPDVVVLDWFLPVLNGLDACQTMIERGYCGNVVLLSTHADDDRVVETVFAGGKALLGIDASAEELVEAVRHASRGETSTRTAFVEALAKAVQQPNAHVEQILSLREREVLQLIAEGNTTKEIAATLNLAVKTVDHRRERIMKKLNLHTVAELTRYAIRNGLLQA